MAGVDPGYVEDLVRLGILKAGEGDQVAPGDVRRAGWVHALDVAGIPLEGMATAVREGALSFAFFDATAYDRFATLTGSTFVEVSERSGLPLDLVMLIREALGFAAPQPEDFVREDEMSVLPIMALHLESGFSPAVVERLLRVYGESLRRIVETEAEAWGTDVVRPLVESGMTEGAALEAQAGIGSRMAPLMDRAVMTVYHGQQEHAWRKVIAETVEGALEGAGLYSRLPVLPAVCFLDLTGYTALTEEKGDEAAADLAGRLSSFVRRSAGEHGGQPVKWLGDGVMFYFPEPGPGVLAALDMMEGVASHSLPPAHTGIHSGPVVFQEGDYFGRTVNIAARIAEYARPGEVLVSEEVVEATEELPVTYTDVGPVELKGVSNAVRLFSAGRPG
jgi:adenylate cyclase